MIVETDPCSISELTPDSKCFRCLSPSQKRIATVWFMAQLLKLIDGADYTDVNDLMEASKCLKCEPDSTLEDFEIVIWLNAAMDAGLSAMTLAEVQAAIKCFFCLDPKAVKAAKTLLLCRISAIQSAPIVL